MNVEEFIHLRRNDNKTVHYMIRGHGVLTGNIININTPPSPIYKKIITYTKVGTALFASSQTDIAVCQHPEVPDGGAVLLAEGVKKKRDYDDQFPDIEIGSWEEEDEMGEHPAGVYLCIPDKNPLPYFLLEKLLPGGEKDLNNYIKGIYDWHAKCNFKGHINIHLLTCLGYEDSVFTDISNDYKLAEAMRNAAVDSQHDLERLLKANADALPARPNTHIQEQIEIVKNKIQTLIKQSKDYMKSANDQSYEILTNELLIHASNDIENPLARTVSEGVDAAALLAMPLTHWHNPEQLSEVQSHAAKATMIIERQRQKQDKLLTDAFAGLNLAAPQAQPPPPPAAPQAQAAQYNQGVGGAASAHGGAHGGARGVKKKRTRKIKQKKRKKTIIKRKKRTLRRKKQGGMWKTRHKYQKKLKNKKKKAAEKARVKTGTINPVYEPNEFGRDGKFQMTNKLV